MLRCRRCGRMLRVHYVGKRRNEMRYQCVSGNINRGTERCISFGGVRIDQAVSAEILQAVQPNAISAALQAAEQAQHQQGERTHALQLELEQARYEARLAARRYEAVDPDNRLVASELEARWNATLCRVREIETKLEQTERQSASAPAVSKEQLLRLAGDLPVVWESPSTDPGIKQRIVRILIEEIVADVDEGAEEIVLVIHWAGGHHSELRVRKLRTGQHRRCTKAEAVEIVRQMAAAYSDEQIALTLNRLGLKTGVGNTWNEVRVRSLRSHLKLPACKRREPDGSVLNLQQAAMQLGVSATVVRRLIACKVLPAKQVVPGAPWQIGAVDVASPTVVEAAVALKHRNGIRWRSTVDEEDTLWLPGLKTVKV